MKKILIPTDFSDNAYNAVLYGLSLFLRDECEIILINTFNIPYTGHDVVISSSDEVEDKTEESFGLLIDKINNQFKGYKFHITSEYHVGDLQGVVNKVVADKGIDQIIMGTQGASGLKKVLIGSSTASVVKNVSCDLLAVPENSIFSIPKKIVLAIDDYQDLNEEVLFPLISLAQHFDSEILLFHVTDILEERVEEDLNVIYKYFSKVKHSVHGIHSADVAFALEEFAKSEEADIVALIHDQQNFFVKLFHKSLTKRMIYHAELPILVLQN